MTAETRPAARARALGELARAEGFSDCGVCLPSRSEHGEFLRGWLAGGRHGTMTYLARPDAVDRRVDPTRSLDDVRAIAMVAHPYLHDEPHAYDSDSSAGIVARYARGRDYHRVVKGALIRIHRAFERWEGTAVPARAYVDTGPLLERELAARAGLGWFGRNTMLIHPRRGSYFFLGALLLGVDVEPSHARVPDHCGSCDACIGACPTDALLGRDRSGAPVMDATRCISYLTIESRDPIPRALRPAIGNRVYGCDICQEVCPFNARFAEASTEDGYAARGPGERPVGVQALFGKEGPGRDVEGSGPDRPSHPGTASPNLVNLLTTALDEGAWDEFSRGSPIRRAGRAGFARNVCVALGNWRSPEAVPVLVEALADRDPIVRGHAAWALGRISLDAGRAALEAARSVEEDAFVRAELEEALIDG